MTVSEIESSVITKGRYKYVADVKIGPPEAIDVHHIFIARRGQGAFWISIYLLLFAFICFSVLIFSQDTTSVFRLLTPEQPVAIVLGSFAFAGFIVRRFLGKQIEKESVTIFPAFGVQLETVYRSGRTLHHFVPIGRILKAVLNECVTPVTCYWSLSLILRGEEELLLVFKVPSMKNLEQSTWISNAGTSIWEALKGKCVLDNFQLNRIKRTPQRISAFGEKKLTYRSLVED